MELIDSNSLNELRQSALQCDTMRMRIAKIISMYKNEIETLRIIANKNEQSEYVRHLAATKIQTFEIFILQLELI